MGSEKKSVLFTREGAAYHEAGHAVAAIALGGQLEWVSLAREGWIGGKTKAAFPHCAALRLYIQIRGTDSLRRRTECELERAASAYGRRNARRAVALYSLAGEQATLILLGMEQLGLNETLWGSQQDIGEVNLEAIGPNPYIAIERGRRRVHRLLTRYWPAVECLAQRLLAVRRLTGMEVGALLGRWFPRSPDGRSVRRSG